MRVAPRVRVLEFCMRTSSFIFAVYRILRIVEKEAGLDGLDARAKALLLLIALPIGR